MRFEVEVDDGANLDALHKARVAFNAAHPESAAPDMPSFVQALMDRSVAAQLQSLPGPVTLPAALEKIAQLEAELTASVATAKPA